MEHRSQEWIDQTTLKIRETFEIFDKDKTDSVPEEDVGTMIRALGIYPTETALTSDIIPEILEDDVPAMINYRRFKIKMLQMLAEKQYQPDSRDVILQAFRTIDPQNKGYITAETMESYCLGYGTPFKGSEMDAFFKVARDPDTGNIHYEDYVALFPKDM